VSYATFTPEGDSALSILQPARGLALTVNLYAGSRARVVLIVSEEDYQKVGKPRFAVTDLMTGMTHSLKAASCGAGCRCAVTFA
jgi:hypothetical protein